jgi:hypothetical protein
MSLLDHAPLLYQMASNEIKWTLVSWLVSYIACFLPNRYFTLETKVLNSVLIVAGISVALISSWCAISYLLDTYG